LPQLRVHQLFDCDDIIGRPFGNKQILYRICAESSGGKRTADDRQSRSHRFEDLGLDSTAHSHWNKQSHHVPRRLPYIRDVRQQLDIIAFK
jgi:hypothetical protein